MKFAHIADCHIGGWRDLKMQDVGMQAFSMAIDRAISEGVDFLLIAGDLFNTSIPPIDKIKAVVKQLNRLKDEKIPVYMVAGSHDYSPSGKTMLDVLEETGLFSNVCRGEVVDGKLRLNYTIDEKTGAKITGMLGKKGMLEKHYYEDLDREALEKENGFKIFLFHTAITELKPEELQKMESASVSLLPKGFDYYAGGHVHITKKGDFDDRNNVIYPGPVFPNSFSEIEKMRKGSMCLFEDGDVTQIDIEPKKVVCVKVDCNHKTSNQVQNELRDKFEGDVYGAIVTIRLFGTLETGNVTDINLLEIFDELYSKGAHFVLKNSNKLHSKEFKQVSVVHDTIEEIENALIEEQWGNLSGLADKNDETALIRQLMQSFSAERLDGENKADYEQRIAEQGMTAIKIIKNAESVQLHSKECSMTGHLL
ncbi:MAG: exonuclease SbcCD subunit D [Candidatus Nanoarchaeia archaeon]